MSGKMYERMSERINEAVKIGEVPEGLAAHELDLMKLRLMKTIEVEMDIANLASICRLDWKSIYFGAAPYLDAMRSIHSKGDMYGLDTATSVVLYFLSNATTWRGPVAKAVKARLKELVK